MNHLRVPPHDILTEQAVLGAIIQFPDVLPKIKNILSREDFYRESHALIYESALSTQDLDFVTLHADLKKREVLETIGGEEYLISLIQNTLTSAGIKKYAQILKDLSHKRQIISLCLNITESAYGNGNETDIVLSQLKSGIRDIETDQPANYTPNNKILANRLDVIQSREKGEQPGYSTGIYGLDRRTYGLWPKCTYVLKAKSQSGKSSLALNIGDNVAAAYPDKQVLYFILESSKEYTSDRRLTRESRIPLTRIQLGNIYGESEWEKLKIACDTLPQNIILLDDPKFNKYEKIESFTESFILEHQASLIIIDYIQLLYSSRPSKSRHLELSYLASQINQLAKRSNAPVLYLSQINKDGETKESGDIFNAADVVMTLTRETDETDATLKGEKGRDISVPFTIKLSFQKNTQTWSG